MKISRLGFICVLGLLVFTTACDKKETEDSLAQTSLPIEDSIEAFGTVKAGKVKNISLAIPAIVKEVHVVEGQKVALGEILISLDLSNYEQEVKDKETEQNIAKLELQKLQGGSGAVQNNLSASQKEAGRIQKELETKRSQLENNTDPDIKKLLNDCKLAETSYKDAEDDFGKQKILYEQGGISESDFNTSKRNLEDKKNQVESIKLSIDTLKFNKQKEINELQKSLDQANTSINNAQIELGSEESGSLQIQKEKIAALEDRIKRLKEKTNQSYIKNHKIISDVKNGVVYEIGYVEGDIIDESKKVLSIMDLGTVIVEANVSEEFIKDIKIGSEVEILPVADVSKEYKGKVSKIASMAIKHNGETVVPVEIAIGGKDEFLRPNFNVDVKIFK